MEGGGGGVGGGYAFGTLPPPIYRRHTQPLSAIDRFLRGHPTPTMTTSFCEVGVCFNDSTLPISGSTTSIGGGGGGFIAWPAMQDSSYVNEGEIYEEKKSKGKKRGRSNYEGFIKGQWTDDEDRKLVKLVREHGEQKWAKIAEYLQGRAGKQCRERWQNHLRPNIKKDSWSEDEERLLVEAHEKYGNKWAEIAKRIPGRTENSIKNHWNATKRRQYSKRRTKKVETQGEKPKCSILQDYIKNKCMFDSSQNSDPTTTTDAIPNKPITTTTTITTTTAAMSATSSNTLSSTSTTQSDDPASQYETLLLESSDNHESSTFIDDPCHDELVFMQNLFKNSLISHNSSSHDYDEIIMESSSSLKATATLELYPMSNHQSINPITNNSITNHSYSDLYLSYLLDGSNYISTSNDNQDHDMSHHDDHVKMDMMNMHHHACSSGQTKDMDLMEMLYSSQFFQGNT